MTAARKTALIAGVFFVIRSLVTTDAIDDVVQAARTGVP
jgi:hypothetical protein